MLFTGTLYKKFTNLFADRENLFSSVKLKIFEYIKIPNWKIKGIAELINLQKLWLVFSLKYLNKKNGVKKHGKIDVIPAMKIIIFENLSITDLEFSFWKKIKIRINVK